MRRLTRKEAEQRKQENSLANWSSIIVKNASSTVLGDKQKSTVNLVNKQNDKKEEVKNELCNEVMQKVR